MRNELAKEIREYAKDIEDADLKMLYTVVANLVDVVQANHQQIAHTMSLLSRPRG